MTDQLVERLAEIENPALKDRVSGVKRIEMELPFEDRVGFLMKFVPSLVDNYPKEDGGLERLSQFYHNLYSEPVSIRDMAGTFLTASRIAHRRKTEITQGIINSVSQYQQKLFVNDKNLRPIEVIGAAVNLVSDLSVKDVMGKSRTRPVVEARNYVFLALDRICGLGFSESARVMGKTHATAIRGVSEAIKKLGGEEKVELFTSRVKSNLRK